MLLRGLGKKSSFVVLAILFRSVLELGYWLYVHPIHEYKGFSWNPTLAKYVESWCIFILLALFAPYRLKKPSDFFMNILLFGLMVPLLSFYGLTNQSRQHLYIVLLGYALISVFRRGRSIYVLRLRQGRVFALTLVGIGALGVSAWFIASGGLTFFNLDLTQVYQFRRSAGSVINASLMGYINTWAWKIFGPALLAIGLWRKNYWLAILVVGLHVLWFGISAHKAVLFYPFLVFFLWFWLRKTDAMSIFPLGLMSIILLSILSFSVLNYGLPASFFVRRVFYVIANNTFAYYEFFSTNDFVFWSNSITSSFIEYPYHIGPAKLIGEWKGTEAHVNNTFLSTGFMHAGIPGIIFYGISAGFLFRIIDSIGARGIPTWVALSILIVPCRSLLLSADLPTAILTHGIGVGIVVLFLIRGYRQDTQMDHSRDSTAGRIGALSLKNYTE